MGILSSGNTKISQEIVNLNINVEQIRLETSQIDDWSLFEENEKDKNKTFFEDNLV